MGGPGLLAIPTAAIKLYTTHEHWLVCPTHVLWRFNREPCTERRCLQCVLHARRPPQLWRGTGLLDRSLRHVDAIIAPSRFTREKHIEFGLRVDAPIVHVFIVPIVRSSISSSMLVRAKSVRSATYQPVIDSGRRNQRRSSKPM